MSESLRPNPDQETNQKLLESLGEDFNVSWDALQVSQDFSKLPKEFVDQDKKKIIIFNEEKFFKTLKKLAKDKPVYLEYVKRLFKEELENSDDKKEEPSTEEEKEMAEFYKKNPKLKTNSAQQPKTKSPQEMADLAAKFIKRLEFFSNLNKPKEIEISRFKTAREYEAELEKNGFQIGDYARFMMNSKDFAESLKENKEKQKIDLVRLKVKDLFRDKENHTIEQIYDKAAELDLDICPPEVGPAYRLAYPEADQPMNEWLGIAMKQISDPDRNPNVFNLERNADGAWLNNNWANPMNKWNSENEFVFRLRSSVPDSIIFSALTWCGFSFPDFPGFFSSHQAFFQPRPV